MARFGRYIPHNVYLAPCNARYPFGFVLALTGGIVPHAVDGDVEAAADRAVIGGLHIGIASDISDYLYFVQSTYDRALCGGGAARCYCPGWLVGGS